MDQLKHLSTKYFFYPTVLGVLYIFLDIIDQGLHILWSYPSIYYYGFWCLAVYWIVTWYLMEFNEGGYYQTRKRKRENPKFISELNESIPSHDQSVSLASQCSTLIELFYSRVKLSPRKAAWYEKNPKTKKWTKTSFEAWYDASRSIAKSLVTLGIKQGESVSISGTTKGKWCIADMGVQMIGGVSVGIYPKQSIEALQYLFELSDTRVVFVEAESDLNNILPAIKGNTKVVAVVCWDDEVALRHRPTDSRVLPWSVVIKEPLPESEVEKMMDSQKPEDVAALMFSSGTTGSAPKAVMITHSNVLKNMVMLDLLPQVYDDDLTFNFIPLAHASERWIGSYYRISCGVSTCFASSIAASLDEIQEAKPTIFGSVPRIFEKAYSNLLADVESRNFIWRAIFSWAKDVGVQKARLDIAQMPISMSLAVQYLIANKLVFKQIRRKFLGGRISWFFTGASAISLEALEFFWACGFQVYDIYGLSETTAVTHANIPGQTRLGTVGKPFPGIEHKIADDGEILVKGPIVFKGYYKNEKATKDALDNGWLHTGDIGYIDQNNFLKITDRKKHVIVTANNRIIAPSNVEMAIKGQDSLISYVHIHGDKRPYLTALIAPNPLEVLSWGVQHGILEEDRAQSLRKDLQSNARREQLVSTISMIVSHPEFVTRLRDSVRNGNAQLPYYEQVKRFYLLNRDFSQERGELTPTMKVKRRDIEKMYQSTFDRIYKETNFGVIV